MSNATIESTKTISPTSAKAILTKAGIGGFYVGVNDYRGEGFQFINNSFQWTSNRTHTRQLEITLILIAYLNNASISYEIADVRSRWSDRTYKQAIVLTNGAKAVA
jgi:hypothetical protein